MLPIAQIGMMLSQNQWTEELPHAQDPGKADLSANFNHPYLAHPDYLSGGLVFPETKDSAYIHHSEEIPSNHSTEVVTPPPDSSC
jgi:hypothetical protein